MPPKRSTSSTATRTLRCTRAPGSPATPSARAMRGAGCITAHPTPAFAFMDCMASRWSSDRGGGRHNRGPVSRVGCASNSRLSPAYAVVGWYSRPSLAWGAWEGWHKCSTQEYVLLQCGCVALCGAMRISWPQRATLPHFRSVSLRKNVTRSWRILTLRNHHKGDARLGI